MAHSTKISTVPKSIEAKEFDSKSETPIPEAKSEMHGSGPKNSRDSGKKRSNSDVK